MRGDIPLLSQWIKKSRSEERDFLERIMGVEPTYSAWEANVLPINYIRVYSIIPHFLLFASINP